MDTYLCNYMCIFVCVCFFLYVYLHVHSKVYLHSPNDVMDLTNQSGGFLWPYPNL